PKTPTDELNSAMIDLMSSVWIAEKVRKEDKASLALAGIVLDDAQSRFEHIEAQYRMAKHERDDARRDSNDFHAREKRS
ncbi:hypothetical protein NL374_27780, partial [Klebsiella pneumoniae]|nr:hypothetical protein [Klebsiella pneumoniae]